MEDEIFQYYCKEKGNVTLKNIALKFNISNLKTHQIITNKLKEQIENNVTTIEISTTDVDNPEYGLDFNIEKEIEHFDVEKWLNNINKK